MNIWNSLAGMLEIEIVCADTARMLTILSDQNLQLYHLQQMDSLTFRCWISRNHLRDIRRITEKGGASLHIIRKKGLYWTGKNLLKRPALWIGLVFLLLSATILPTRIFFIHVEGNAQISSRYIQEQAASCGICFGASRRKVRSEQVKNALLETIPELQWAGVNTKGCIATISVKERSVSTEEPEQYGVSRIVALRDGVIKSCTVKQGSPICAVGDAVKRGQVLVSGYTDCGLQISAERSEAEIFAETERNLFAVTPVKCLKKTDLTRSVKKYSLIIGKKRINFYNGSGILGTSCAKIYKEYCMTLPGGFVLPVKMIQEEWIYVDTVGSSQTESNAELMLKDFSEHYLNQQMIAGTVLNCQETVATQNGCYILAGEYACHEMIGQEQSEEIMQEYGKTS